MLEIQGRVVGVCGREHGRDLGVDPSPVVVDEDEGVELSIALSHGAGQVFGELRFDGGGAPGLRGVAGVELATVEGEPVRTLIAEIAVGPDIQETRVARDHDSVKEVLERGFVEVGHQIEELEAGIHPLLELHPSPSPQRTPS
ncbi:hypothetical protein [Streptomyces lushanensis]|uniref:hypothetical protein n=1 Tax=Streptomyces lushanensis TaxID=1434255 RepID=UPI003CCC2418